MQVEIYAALLGAFVGVLFTYWFALLITKAQARSTAASNFRATFSSTTSQMAIAQIDKSINIEALLNRTFPELSVAIEIYRPFVPRKDLCAYQEAWDSYCKVAGSVRFFDYYMPSSGDTLTPYELFKKRIAAIITHANP